MLKRAITVFLAGLTVIPATVSLAADSKPVPPTIQQLAAFPRMASFTISDDGKHMAALEARGENRVILVWDTADLGKAPTVIGATAMKIQRVQFVKNDLLGVTMWQPYDSRLGSGVTKTFISKLYITDLEGRNWREPVPQEMARTEIDERIRAATSASVLDMLRNDPDHVLVVNNVGSGDGDIFRVNVRNGRAERVQRSEENTGNYTVDVQGNIRARTRYDTDNTGAFIATELRDPKTGSWSEHFRSYVKNRDVQGVVGFAADPNIAYILSNVGEDKALIYEYDISARKRGETVFKHKYFEAKGIISYPYADNAIAKRGDVLGFTYDGPSGSDVYWVSPAFQSLDKALRGALNINASPVSFSDPATGVSGPARYDLDRQFDIVDFTPDLKSVIVRVSGPAMPPATYLLQNGALKLLSNAYPDIDARSLGSATMEYYKARDGLTIPAILTKPSVALCGPGPWPTVIHPHGGPWSRDSLGFDGSMWVPLMSSRCYAVLQPQYRGSQGWSKRLWLAGDSQWGGQMQDDKDDGVKWLVDRKIAIPGRVAMFGFSYGGYAAMAAAVRPNGLYKCAIAGAGVSDIRKIWSDFYTNPFFRQAQGRTVSGLSPVDKANEIKIPIMVYHGERDQTVPIEQSQWFVGKARNSGQKVVYHELKDFAHGPAWTRAIMAEQLGYIDDYLRNDCGGGGL